MFIINKRISKRVNQNYEYRILYIVGLRIRRLFKICSPRVGDIIVGCDLGVKYRRDCIIEAIDDNYIIIRGNQSVSERYLLGGNEMDNFMKNLVEGHKFIYSRGEWYPK